MAKKWKFRMICFTKRRAKKVAYELARKRGYSVKVRKNPYTKQYFIYVR